MHTVRMRSLTAVVLRLRNHRCMRVALRVDGGEVLIVIAVRSVAMSQCNLIEALRTKEGLEPQPEHVEGRDASGEQADEPERIAERASAQERLVKDLVLGEETCEGRNTCNGEDAGGHGPEGDGDTLAQAA